MKKLSIITTRTSGKRFRSAGGSQSRRRKAKTIARRRRRQERFLVSGETRREYVFGGRFSSRCTSRRPVDDNLSINDIAKIIIRKAPDRSSGIGAPVFGRRRPPEMGSRDMTAEAAAVAAVGRNFRADDTESRRDVCRRGFKVSGSHLFRANISVGPVIVQCDIISVVRHAPNKS